MTNDLPWIVGVKETLQPHIGALTDIVVEDALQTLDFKPEAMVAGKIASFLRALKEFLPAELDRDQLIAELGRIMLNNCVRVAMYRQGRTQ